MYKKLINKKVRLFASWMLVIVLQLTTVLPFTQVYALEGVASAQVESTESTTPGAIELEEVESEEFALDVDNPMTGINLMSTLNLEVDSSVIHTITATIEDVEDYRPVMGDTIGLKIYFTLPERHDYGDGSVLNYPLPTPLKAANGTGQLRNESGVEYGTFGIIDGNVIITFNGNIRFFGDEGSEGLKTDGWFEIEGKFEAEEGNTGLEQEITLPGGQVIKLEFQPLGGEVIVKEAAPENSGNSSTSVTWTINANTVMDDLGEGMKLTDTLIGNHTYKEGTLKVIRYKLDSMGTRSDDTDVTTDYLDTLDPEKNHFTLNLKGKYAYEIEYQTIPGETDEKNQELKNEAIFNGSTTGKTTIINYGDPLTKTVSKSGEQANWTITVNGNRKTMPPGTTITDGWDSDKHELIPGSFKVNEIDNPLPLGLTVAHSDQGFVLTLGQEISEKFTITYSTKPKDLVTGPINIKNQVVRSDRDEDIKYGTGYYSQNVLAKTNSNLNYQDKTVDWKITINQAAYTMENIVVTDTFVQKNLKIIDSTFRVREDGVDISHTRTDLGSDGSVPGDKKGGFTLNIPGPITKPVTITFTTEYDVRGVTNLIEYTNRVGLEWKTNGKDYTTKDVESTVRINNQQEFKGYKTGSYNYETKRFKWSVGINYNFDTVVNPIFTDILSGSQEIDPDSIKVYQLDLTAGGDGVTVGGPLVKGQDYNLSPSTLENTFTISFIGDYSTITTSYLIVYESKNKDDYYEPTNADYTVTNQATLTGDDGYSGNWTKTVTVNHTKDLITKDYRQEGKSAKLHWTMKLNWGQSELYNVVITDLVGNDTAGNPNQMLYKDSIKVYEMNFNGTNGTPTKGTAYEPGEVGQGLYHVTFDEPESTFKIYFNEPISKAIL